MVPASPLQLGSNSKLLLATAVMSLVDDGAVELDAAVEPPLARDDLDGITLRHLMSHSSGLPSDADAPPTASDRPLRDWVDALPPQRRAVPPGAEFHYSSSGWLLVA